MINSIEKIMLFVGVLFMASCVLVAADKNKDTIVFDGPYSTCSPEQHQCHSWECIPKSALCDGDFDCMSRDDETGCCNEHFDLVGGRCLVAIPTINCTWYEAKFTCLTLDAQLVNIDDSSYFYGELIKFIRDNSFSTDRNYWVGASDEAIEGDWKWGNGANVTKGTPLWAIYSDQGIYKQEPGQGSQDHNCGYLDHRRLHYMDDRDCYTQISFICEQETLQVSSKESPASEREEVFSKRIMEILQSSEKKQEHQKTILTK